MTTFTTPTPAQIARWTALLDSAWDHQFAPGACYCPDHAPQPTLAPGETNYRSTTFDGLQAVRALGIPLLPTVPDNPDITNDSLLAGCTTRDGIWLKPDIASGVFTVAHELAHNLLGHLKDGRWPLEAMPEVHPHHPGGNLQAVLNAMPEAERAFYKVSLLLWSKDRRGGVHDLKESHCDAVGLCVALDAGRPLDIEVGLWDLTHTFPRHLEQTIGWPVDYAHIFEVAATILQAGAISQEVPVAA